MKAIIFLCFALIASQHMAAAISRAEILALIQQDTNVDRLQELFLKLQATTNQDLESLDAAYSENEPVLAGEIVRTTELLTNKVAACDGIDQQVADGRDHEQRLRDNIQAAQDTIDGNNAKAEAARDARCASNLLFISELANRQEAIEFLTYLRGRVADPAFADYLRDQSGAFIQLKAALATKKESEILTLLAKHHMLSTLQKKSKQNYEGENDLGGQLTASVRTADEVGTDYQDNDRGALQVQNVGTDTLSVDDYVQKLLGYIDELVAQLQGDAQKLQGAETAAVQAFIEYQQQLKDQNYVLNQYIIAATNQLTELVAVDDANEEAGRQCRQEVIPLQEGVQAAQENHDNYVQAYQQRRANLVATINLFAQVIQVYQEQVLNVAPQAYKERADDYLDNQVFDSTQAFTARASVGA